MTDPVAERDAGVTKRELDGARGLADYAMREDGGEAAVMRIRAGFVIRLLDALAAERQRGREEMRDRAAECAVDFTRPATRPPFDVTAEFHNSVLDEIGADIATAIRSLSTED